MSGQHLNAPAARAAQQPISLEAFKGLRVLVVEDEPALAVAVSEALPMRASTSIEPATVRRG